MVQHVSLAVAANAAVAEGTKTVARCFAGDALKLGLASAAPMAWLVPRGGGQRVAIKKLTPNKKKSSTSLPAVKTEAEPTTSNTASHMSRIFLQVALAIYVTYPVASLMLFRLPEQISWLGLFQHSHQCSGTLHRHWDACLRLYLAHAFTLLPLAGGMWLWVCRRQTYSKSTKWKISMTALVMALVVFKVSVDHWQLYKPPLELSLQGKVAVITGANRGIGLATALALAERGAHVVVTCRSLDKCQSVVDRIAALPTAKGSAQAAVLDLTSLESAAQLTEQLAAQYPEIHYFFANAGTTPRFELTAEGLEDGFGGMHLAHMAVVLGLLPNLQQGGSVGNPSRVVVVASEMSVNAAMGIFGKNLIFTTSKDNDEETANSTTLANDLLDDWRGETTRGDGTIGPSLPAYGRAKLCGVLFALELNRRLKRQGAPVVAHAVHTGAVATDSSRDAIVKAFPRWIPGMQWIVGHVYFPLLWRQVEGGARSLLCPALSQAPYILQGGQYLDALCRPFQHDFDPNISREKETTIPLPSFLWGGSEAHTLQVDPVQALLLADTRWSERLWNVSLAFLEESPAKHVLDNAP